MVAHGVVVVAVLLVMLHLIYPPVMAVTAGVIVGALYGLIYRSTRGILGQIGPEREKRNYLVGA